MNLLIPPRPEEPGRGFLVLEGLASSHGLRIRAAAFVVHKAREERAGAGRGSSRVRRSLCSNPRQILHLTTRGRARRERTLRYAETGSPPILLAGVAIVAKPPWIVGDLGLLVGNVAGPTSGVLSCDAISSSGVSIKYGL